MDSLLIKVQRTKHFWFRLKIKFRIKCKKSIEISTMETNNFIEKNIR